MVLTGAVQFRLKNLRRFTLGECQKHRFNEEVYIFLQGKGEFQVDDCVFAIGEGSVVRVDPNGERCMRNISDTEDLCWIVIQSRVDSHPDNTIQDGFSVQRSVSWVDKQQV